MFFALKKIKIILTFILVFGFFATITFPVFAFVMSSSNYKIEKDSLNIGGLDNSSSSNYHIQDTIGEIATGKSNSSNYVMNAGYRQMDETYLAVSIPSIVSLSPSIGGLTGGTANGSGTWTVKTDASAGYRMSIKATSSPALVSGANSFADYTPASSNPDYTWNIGSANSEFGFSPYGNSVVDKYKNNGSVCNAGSSITDGACWDGLSTTNKEIVNKNSRTSVSGDDTKLNFRAEVSGMQVAGTYYATIVTTVISN